MPCILVGNYGCGNMGDEALRDYFLRRYPDSEWIVVSAQPNGDARPRELPPLPIGIRSFFGLQWWKTVQAIKRADAIVFGGGSLFTDIESLRACFLWASYAWAARFFRVPIFLCSQGIGPFRWRVGEWCARSVLRGAAFVSVRDALSFDRVRSMNISCMQTFDPVFSLMKEKNHQYHPKNVFIIIPRKNAPKTFADHVRTHVEKNIITEMRIVSLQPGDSEEKRVCAELRQNLPVSSSVVDASTIDTLLTALDGGSSVLSARYHGALAALALGIPLEIWPQQEGDKLDALRPFLPVLTAEKALELQGLISAEEGMFEQSIRKLKE